MDNKAPRMVHLGLLFYFSSIKGGIKSPFSLTTSFLVNKKNKINKKTIDK
tara:strand:+ start:1134 stop:1283 length:150 start_codon:yes stop_codon:yes gene_type:complete